MKKALTFLLMASLFLVVLAVPLMATPQSVPRVGFSSLESLEAFFEKVGDASSEKEIRTYCTFSECYLEQDRKLLGTAVELARRDGLFLLNVGSDLSQVTFQAAGGAFFEYQYNYTYKNSGVTYIEIQKISPLGLEFIESAGMDLFLKDSGDYYDEKKEIECSGKTYPSYWSDSGTPGKAVYIKHGSFLVAFRFSQEFSEAQILEFLKEIQLPAQEDRGGIWALWLAGGAVVLIGGAVTALLILRRKKAKAVSEPAEDPPIDSQ